MNCQPFVVHSAHGALAVAHNGELFNAGRLRRMVNTNFTNFSSLCILICALCLGFG